MIKTIYKALTYFFLSDFKEQNFLGNPIIPILLNITPMNLRKYISLKILATSPHYFIYQESKQYRGLSRRDILKREHQRNLISRKEICEKILLKYLKPAMNVLDFGCGPGYLAIHVSKYVINVLATDISTGVIACAKILNSAPNIHYNTNNGQNLTKISDFSVDLIYSFAVVQHLSNKQIKLYFKEFYRILKTGGKVICHVIIGNRNNNPRGVLTKNISLRFRQRSEEYLRKLVLCLNFTKLNIHHVKNITNIKDDIGSQHLMVFTKE